MRWMEGSNTELHCPAKVICHNLFLKLDSENCCFLLHFPHFSNQYFLEKYYFTKLKTTTVLVQVSVEIQCNDTEMDNEMKQYFSQHRPLDDIIEDDEESFSPCKDFSSIDQFLENLQCEERLIDSQLEHPLSILSLEKNFASTSGKSSSDNVR